MTRQIKCLYKNECPRDNRIKQISITYAEIPMPGQTAPGYKKMSFSCEDKNGCPKLDQYGRCPLLLKAPDNPCLS